MLAAESAALQASAEAAGSISLMSLSRGNAICAPHHARSCWAAHSARLACLATQAHVRATRHARSCQADAAQEQLSLLICPQR